MAKARPTPPTNRHVVVGCRRFLEKIRLIPTTMSEGDACRAAGIPYNQISRWREGRPIYLDHVHALAKVWGVSLDWWADDEQAGPPTEGGDWAEVMRLARRLGAKRALDRLMMMGEEPEVGEPATAPRPLGEDPPSRRSARKRRASR